MLSLTQIIQKNVHTGSGVHPASCAISNGVLSREVKRPECKVNHSPLSRVQVKN